jgi:hypothetical protein
MSDSTNGTAHSFLFEPVYANLIAQSNHLAAVARCLIQWATDYRAWPTDDSEPVRHGPLPPEGRIAFVNELFDWASGSRVEVNARRRLNLVLLRNGELLLDQTENGLPRRVVLTSAENTTLQACLTASELPNDLFYRADAQRYVVQPAPVMDGNGKILGWTRGEVSYSPLEWRQRDVAAVEQHPVPTEAESQLAFATACDEFWWAVILRLRQLGQEDSETGPSDRHDQLQELRLMLLLLQLSISRARANNELVTQFRDRIVRACMEFVGGR